MKRQLTTLALLVPGLAFPGLSFATVIIPIFGGVLFDDYDPGKDTDPGGTHLYNPQTNEFKGS